MQYDPGTSKSPITPRPVNQASVLFHVMSETRRCYSCGQEKPQSEFPPKSTAQGNEPRFCHPCQKEWSEINSRAWDLGQQAEAESKKMDKVLYPVIPGAIALFIGLLASGTLQVVLLLAGGLLVVWAIVTWNKAKGEATRLFKERDELRAVQAHMERPPR